MTAPTAGRSRNMAAIRRTDTKPEVQVRCALHRAGFRFRKDLPVVTRGRRARPDIAFTRQRLAVFIDGCFWHCCPEHGRSPTINTGYWSPKLARNVERDKLQTEALVADGWVVLRIWEHVSVEAAFREIADEVSRLRDGVAAHGVPIAN
ncbi:very short patch repair endonuclease [Tomitella gaofuii]|uniref:very short patch repair endonuclease n=1 Tax=Tomitella gaofuii TaxID=2760083 RepID=UPI0022A82470|nr:very short patch repair endonuclease [Tomitella gaofuii]